MFKKSHRLAISLIDDKRIVECVYDQRAFAAYQRNNPLLNFYSVDVSRTAEVKVLDIYVGQY
jgi:hypothetical protein